MTDDNRALLQQRLFDLPPRITLTDLEAATGRTAHYLRHYWVNNTAGDFPGAAGTRSDGTKEYDRDAVAQWCDARGLEARIHPDEITDRRRDRVTTAQAAERLHLKDPSAVRYHARKHPPGSDDPYPQAGEDGRRSWPEVLAWHQRHQTAPRGTPGHPASPGLTPRLQQVHDLAQAAAARGETLTGALLARQLDIHRDSASRLLRELRDHQPDAGGQ